MGWIYILTNNAYPGLLKIGYTTTTVEERARSLSGFTGVPSPFEIAAKFSSHSPELHEKRIHKRLRTRRAQRNREFFEIDLKAAIEIAEDVCKEPYKAPPVSSHLIFPEPINKYPPKPVEQGWVYLLLNERMPGLVKIGCTRKHYQARCDELSNATGVPSPFFVLAAFPSKTPEDHEKQIHDKLNAIRLSGQREFFRGCSARIIIEVLSVCKTKPEFNQDEPIRWLSADYRSIQIGWFDQFMQRRGSDIIGGGWDNNCSIQLLCHRLIVEEYYYSAEGRSDPSRKNNFRESLKQVRVLEKYLPKPRKVGWGKYDYGWNLGDGSVVITGLLSKPIIPRLCKDSAQAYIERYGGHIYDYLSDDGMVSMPRLPFTTNANPINYAELPLKQHMLLLIKLEIDILNKIKEDKKEYTDILSHTPPELDLYFCDNGHRR
ncbi:MAG: GIY-YIG nuclease family protein [Rhodospirillaceae bacterium]